MISKKEVREIEAIIDQDFEELEFWKLNKDAALILSCQMFEHWAFQLDELIQLAPNEQQTELKSRLLDLMQACEWLIKKAFEKCSMDGLTIESDEPLLKYTEQAYLKAFIHTKAEQIFMPYWQGLYSAKINNEQEIEFIFPSERFAVFEGINAVLLDDHNKYKLKKYEKVDLSIRKLFANIPEMLYQTRGMAKVEFDFDFPDHYKIGPYTVQEIKNVWRRVIREAWWADRSNKVRKLKDRFPNVHEIHIDSWSLDDVSRDITIKLINDLTYTGQRKGQQRFTTPITEPIFQLSDGRKVISPKFILYNQPGRNILSTLNRIYGDVANNDSDQKEQIFIYDLSAITKEYPNLIICHSVPVDGTDVDYGIYDKESLSLVLFEMKWFVEPVTSVEIKSKDQEISKGLHVQLPKYKEAVENNVKGFTLKAFNQELEVKEISYFVLTRVTIGSGLIEPSPFRVVNLRMIKKALFDAKGKLNIAVDNLKQDFYYPKTNEEFSLEKDTIMMGKVRVIVDSFKTFNSSFDLSVPDDEIVYLHGIEMNPDKMPQNQAREVGPSQYELIPKPPSLIKKSKNRKKRKNRKRTKKK